MAKDFSNQTVIKYSKLKLLWFGAMVLVLIWGLTTLIKGAEILQCVMAAVCVLIGTLVVSLEFRELLLINQPRIVLSVQGITDNEGEFYNWSVVSGEKITAVGNYKPNYFLSFSSSGRSRKLHLSGLYKSPAQILVLVKQYRESYIKRSIGDGH